MARISEEMRRHMIAEAAYYRAQRRGFDGGDPVADWLEAEAEVDARANGRPAGIGMLEERLAMANERLAGFRKWLAQSTSDVREEWDGDVRKLARQRDKLRKRIAEIRDEGEDVAEKAWRKAESAWEEITASIQRLSHRAADRK